ncbi:MAG: creatininase family protein [Alphaproteobacteria bacterium]|nr:creatininase family protein [Alphaproteobacteria bacterium]
MTALPRRYWQDMTSEEFTKLDPAKTVALLQVSAIEQHGPHLPVSVDWTINQGVVARAVELMPADLPVTILPAMPVGKSNEHLAFPGTLTFSAETLIRIWTELGECVHRAGLRKLVYLNSHGGQPQVMEIVARDLRVRLGMMAVASSTYALTKPPGTLSEWEMANGIHGGEGETSIMLHLRPDTVHMDRAKNFVPIMPTVAAENEVLRTLGPIGIAWQAQDLHPDGAAGDASKATAELGRRMIDAGARKLVTLLGEVSRYPLSRVNVVAPGKAFG